MRNPEFALREFQIFESLKTPYLGPALLLKKISTQAASGTVFSWIVP